MATNKMQRQYRVTNGYNPVTKKKILRPVITNRKKMNLDQIVEYCLNAGFVRGQFHDMRGNLNGFIEGMKQRGTRSPIRSSSNSCSRTARSSPSTCPTTSSKRLALT